MEVPDVASRVTAANATPTPTTGFLQSVLNALVDARKQQLIAISKHETLAPTVREEAQRTLDHLYRDSLGGGEVNEETGDPQR